MEEPHPFISTGTDPRATIPTPANAVQPWYRRSIALGLINPHSTFGFSLLIAVLTYHLGWSDLYPTLSTELLFFMAAAVFISFVLARASRPTSFALISAPVTQRVAAVTICLYVLWSIEFYDAGGIPLLKILFNVPYDYRFFGIKTLHVFIVTFSSFYAIYVYHQYLSTKRKALLVFTMLNLVPAILIYNRGMLLFNLTGCAMLYITNARRLSFIRIGLFVAIVFVLMFFFGVLGTLRTSRLSKRDYSNNEFLKTGGARESFKKSPVPKEYFWTYIYVSSPIANLQTNITAFPDKEINFQRMLLWVNSEILPDFVSKRINAHLTLPAERYGTIPGPFNVSTIFSGSYTYLGWIGMWLMLAVIISLPFIYQILISRESPFFLTGFSILSTMLIFAVFDNMLRFTGLSLQLAYPVVLGWALPRVTLLRKIFIGYPC